MAYTIAHEELGYYRKFTGNLDLEDIISANITALEDAHTHDLRYVIDDLTDIASSTLSDNDLPSIVNLNELISHTVGELKIAIVIGHDPLQKALAENFCEQMKDSLFSTSVFNSLGEARGWIAATS